MPSTDTPEIRIRGIGVSPGIAIGPVHVKEGLFIQPAEVEITEERVDSEIQRFHTALEATRAELKVVLDKAADDLGTDDAGIFDAHLLIAEDPTLISGVEKTIRTARLEAGGAFWRVIHRYTEAMRKSDNEYLRERLNDVEDVARRVVRQLRGLRPGVSHTEPHVLVAHDLLPSETVSMDRSLVRGFATESGSPTSHTAILARSLGIPAVVGLHDLSSHLRSGLPVLLDGYQGLVIIHPADETLAAYKQLAREKSRLNAQLHRIREGDATTRDGHRVIISSNIELASEMPQVLSQGAEGVGLYRTEFMFINRTTLPTEEEQAAEYAEVARTAGEHGVIIRTLDIGGDKLPAGEDWETEANPFLGWRGIRRSLQQPEVFKTQLRAILRASAHGRVRVMYPLISDVSQIRQASALLAECRDELTAEGVPMAESIEVGAMIEVPSAAVLADVLAKEVDFFSVGTNDLIQYTIAVDRVNERVAGLYQPWHPAILRLLRTVSEAAKSNGIWAGVCGEMAGDILMTPLLVGLGFVELSVGSSQIPRLKHAVRTLDHTECAALVERLLRTAGDAREIHRRSREMARTYYAELLD